MSLAVLLVLLMTAPADSLRVPLLQMMAHPDSAVAEYYNAGLLVREVLGAEEAWEIAALLGTEPKSWDLPAIRAEWCVPPPKTEQRMHFAFHAGSVRSVVLVDLQRGWATLGPAQGATAGYQDVRDRWNPLIGQLRGTFPGERALKSVKLCGRDRDFNDAPSKYTFEFEAIEDSVFHGVPERFPEPLVTVSPTYPPEALEEGVHGIVAVQALVDREGQVRKAQVVESIPMLDGSAMECVKRWTFRPAENAGRKVAAWVTVPVLFKIH